MTRTDAVVSREQKQRGPAGRATRSVGPGAVLQQGTVAVGDGAARSRRKSASGQATLVGREPRVDLLPAEVHVERRERAVARRVWLAVVVLAVVVLMAVIGTTLTAVRSHSDLLASQQQTSTLVGQQQQYTEVKTIERQSALVKSAQAVGGSTEIDWQKYLGDLKASLPAGVTIAGLAIDSASPIAAYTQAATPLQGQRIATLRISVSSPSIPSVPVWTDSLSNLTGYVDSSITSITRQGDGSAYTADITLHINEKAYDGKYAGSR